MKIPVVMFFRKFDYGHVLVIQDHERESDLLPLGDPDRLIPMGPRLWRGVFRTLLPMAIGDMVEDVGRFLPGICGGAYVFEDLGGGAYVFEGSGPLEIVPCS